MERLFWNVAQVSLSVSIVIALLLLLRRVLSRRYAAHVMGIIWLVLAVRLLIPVQLTLPHAPVTVPSPVYQANAQQIQPDTPAGLIFAAQIVRTQEEAPQTLPPGLWCAGLWAAGALGILTLHGVAYAVFRRRLGQGRENTRLLAVLEQEKAALGIAKAIKLLTVPQIDCPMLTGFFRVKLLLPTDDITAADARYIFRHELLHYKHRDLWRKLIFLLAQCMHWFNPMVYLLIRCAREDMELASDHAVVQGLPVAEKKQYGQIILRSASRQANYSAFISRFSGEKARLMKRLQGLFDDTVKKRGAALLVAVALLVAAVGGSFAIGQDASATAQELIARAEEWGDALCLRDSEVNAYTVQSVDAGKMQATLVYNRHSMDAFDRRSAVQLSFAWQGDSLEVLSYVPVQESADGVESIAEFQLLYGNTLGFPDNGWLTGNGWAAVQNVEPVHNEQLYEQTKAPVQSVLAQLYLTGGAVTDVKEDYAGDKQSGQTITYRFADGEILHIATLADFPVDWTLADGSNTRTATDLAQRWAQGIAGKSGQPLFPICSAAMQRQMITRQRALADDGGNWYWKIGGSSPSFRDWTVVDTENPNVKRIVYLAYGGGADDYRAFPDGFVQEITVGKENGRSVVTAQRDVAAGALRGMERFQLLFGTGLPLPGYDIDGLQFLEQEGIEGYAYLRDPTETALELFGLRDAVTDVTGEPTTREGADWAVTCVFADGSGAVCIYLYQPEGTALWRPLDWAVAA